MITSSLFIVPAVFAFLTSALGANGHRAALGRGGYGDADHSRNLTAGLGVAGQVRRVAMALPRCVAG